MENSKLESNHTQLNTYDNSWYTPGPALKRALWYIVNIVFLSSSLNPFSGLKVLLLRLFGASVGSNVVIKQNVNIKYPWFLEIKNNVWIGEKVWIDNLAKVYIGNNCCLSQGAMLLCGNHNYKRPSFDLIVQPITLKDGVWIGAQSTVCPGVTCDSHSILSVGSVATKDLAPYSICQGNPAKFVRKRIITD